MAIDPRTRRLVLGENKGGLSGPAIKPMAFLKVHQFYRVVRVNTASRSSAKAGSHAPRMRWSS